MKSIFINSTNKSISLSKSLFKDDLASNGKETIYNNENDSFTSSKSNDIIYEIKNYPKVINKNDQFNQKLYNHLLYLDNIVNNFSSTNSYQSAEYIINKM